MMFEWDNAKAKKNLSKHGILFADTFAVFEDPNALTIEEFRNDEQRYITIGMDAFGRILVVVYTWRRGHIRIISARKAVRYEVKQYESEI
ncbi:MAG: BrnT family toxin [Deltaproteobacteria bacterium]|nr:BrnT family toxin [Deltaproteobacteria bacterium]